MYRVSYSIACGPSHSVIICFRLTLISVFGFLMCPRHNWALLIYKYSLRSAMVRRALPKRCTDQKVDRVQQLVYLIEYRRSLTVLYVIAIIEVAIVLLNSRVIFLEISRALCSVLVGRPNGKPGPGISDILDNTSAASAGGVSSTAVSLNCCHEKTVTSISSPSTSFTWASGFSEASFVPP